MSKIFYLTLLATVLASSSPFPSPPLEASVASQTVYDFLPIASDSPVKDTLGGATYQQVEDTNFRLRPVLKELTKTDYFKYYKVDLSPELCPFNDDELGMCGNRACAVDVIDDESEVPEFWRSQYLGKLAKDSVTTDRLWSPDDDAVASKLCRANGVSVGHEYYNVLPSPSPPSKDDYLDSELEDTNYCYPEDESLSGPGTYVSLPDNPERFTGYGGPHANKVWRAVYQENCFGYFGDSNQDSGTSNAVSSGDGFSAGQLQPSLPAAGSLLSSVLMDSNRYERQEVGGESGRQALNAEKQCVEQRLFYRILSGLQSSVSSHLCYEYLNQTTGEWVPNLDCFMSRVGNHQERLENLYFNYALVSRAVSKLRNYIDDLHFNNQDASADQATRRQLLRLIKSSSPVTYSRAQANDTNTPTSASSSQQKLLLFNETAIFSSPEGRALKSEFRKRVRNVSALMSCVGCDRCRLWGKLQTAGYGTALKLLFELPENPADDPELCSTVMSTFRRSELVALINTLDRLSKSIEAVTYFRNELQSQAVEAEKLAERSEFQQAWDSELEGAWTALKFVFRSYVELPKNLWTLFIHYSAIYWNRFIGRDALTAQYYHLDL
ncbi:Ero1p [Sugiyamaella lignohabitans]|uniref:Ero1p n=1 Tax=Sugiyamaella lignohabitans TaxID=796027 RepID=A0A161HGR4_9ASCO|nr:Ero1p [Sugiyamaella lignohabitans]ANB11057.1 Ero1p [Sugiyamaella lignohabitans]